MSVYYINEIDQLVTGRGTASLFAFTFAATLLVGLAFLPSYILAVLCGWIFGLLQGTVVCITGILLASLLGYWISNFLISDKILERLKKTERYNTLEDNLKDSKFTLITLIFLMRLSPLFPFALTNFLLASFKIKVKEFTAGTFVGMLPRTVVSVFIGSQLTKLDFQKPIESWQLIAGIAATVLLLVMITRMAGKALKA